MVSIIFFHGIVIVTTKNSQFKNLRKICRQLLLTMNVLKPPLLTYPMKKLPRKWTAKDKNELCFDLDHHETEMPENGADACEKIDGDCIWGHTEN